MILNLTFNFSEYERSERIHYRYYIAGGTTAFKRVVAKKSHSSKISLNRFMFCLSLHIWSFAEDTGEKSRTDAVYLFH